MASFTGPICVEGLSHNLWESFLGYLHSSVTFQMRVANLNFNYQPFRQILVPIIKRRNQQKTWKIWISNQSLGNLIFCRVGVLNWPNFSNRFHLSSSMVLRKSSRNAIFFKCDFALCTSDNLVTETVFGCESSPISRNVRSSVSQSVSESFSQWVLKCKKKA